MSKMTSLFAVSSIVLAASAVASAQTVYNSIPSPAPTGILSLGYQATSTDEFGDHVTLAGTERGLSGITVAMSSWAQKADWPLVGDTDSFSHPITVNLYNVDTSGVNPGVGSLIGTKTIVADIPYRPAVWPNNGIYTTVSFDFSGDGITLPDDVIVTFAYNTQTHGASPIGVAGPYNALNVGLSTTGPTVGTDAEAVAAFWDTSHGPFYNDNGVGGVDFLRRDDGWGNPYYTPAFTMTVPEPATLSAVAGLAMFGLRRRRA